jgi:ABC-2 type transport system ATP-binding protein/lipopolysaccharide transport system ATP-binding protein
MTGNAIEAEHLSKRYRLGESTPGRTLREAIAGSVRGLGRRQPREELWSLRDVSFQVPEGQSFGVVGRNGAGKSTLLKILARITQPTAGRSRTRGRLAPLLEVGTGFHPELTGRENVYLNGAILGMSRRDTARRFEEIVTFAGVERFVDTPVKRYSSGMYLRLAFSVAAHLEPDILVVDEVLAVGDAEFQAKCLGRMATVGQEGRTVVFVSHNLEAITRLCSHAVWLDQGAARATGPAGEVVDTYLGTLGRETEELVDDHAGPVTLRSVRVLDAGARPVEVMRREQPFTVEVHFQVRVAVPGLDVAVHLYNVRGVEVLSEAWGDTVLDRPNEPAEYVARLQIPPLLNVGEYTVGVWIGTRYDTFVQETALRRFRLEGDVKGRPRRIVSLELPWDVRRVGESKQQLATLIQEPPARGRRR